MCYICDHCVTTVEDPMRELSIREMRAALGRLDELVEEEGEVVVTKHGKPVARVLPIRRGRPAPSLEAHRASLPPLPVGSEVLVRQDRDERE
jgi:prevent-host-death family protein